jgi:hypothetical protein
MTVSPLPIDDQLEAIVTALVPGATLLLQAPPGAGKTTRVPLALLEAIGSEGSILMIEPRRLAARGAATRLASGLGERVGERVGYSVRLESRTSAATRLEVVTGGIFLRRLQSDPAQKLLQHLGIVDDQGRCVWILRQYPHDIHFAVSSMQRTQKRLGGGIGLLDGPMPITHQRRERRVPLHYFRQNGPERRKRLRAQRGRGIKRRKTGFQQQPIAHRPRTHQPVRQSQRHFARRARPAGLQKRQMPGRHSNPFSQFELAHTARCAPGAQGGRKSAALVGTAHWATLQ